MNLLRLRTAILFGLIPAAMLPASAQTIIFDTGQPTIAGTSLCASPNCGTAAYQDVAGQFTLTQSYSIASAQAWIQAPSTGGQLNVAIRADNGGLPGTSIFSQTYTVPSQAASNWVVFTFTNQPILQASVPYWLSFEPVSGSGLQYAMAGGAPMPLSSYAFYNSLNSGWIVESNGAPTGFGMRLSGTPAAAPTALVDTGAGGTSSGLGLFASGNTGCTPSCVTEFQFVAGQFTLSQAASISSVNGWMGEAYAPGGPIAISLYTDKGGLPGTNLFSQQFTIGALNTTAWVPFVFAAPLPVLPAGTYWVAFEPVAGSASQFGGMFNGAPNPLKNYAVENSIQGGYHATPSSVGMQIFGTTLASGPLGTAARTIETGISFGLPDTPQDIIGGADGQVDTFSYNFITPAGWSEARGTVIQNGLMAGAYSDQGGPCVAGGDCGTGAGRGVSYRTWQNMGTQASPFDVNAVLDGEFQNSGGVVSAGIYAFDAAAFSTAVANSGLATPQFLLNGSTLSALATGGSSLAGLIPAGAVLLSHFQNIPVQTSGQLQTTAITATSSMNVKPGETIVVVFDVTAYAGPGGSANFATTLAPSPTLPLLSDLSGNPLPQLVAVGPSVPIAAVPASLALTAPSPASNPLGSTVHLTATATDASGNPVAGALVFFAFNSGPNNAPAGPIATGADGQAVFTYTGNAGAGTDVIQASIAPLSAAPITATPVSVTWTLPGLLDHIAISPATASIAPGGSQTYTAEGYDRLNDDLGAVTAATMFSIAPDGSCSGAKCTATIVGPHTVVGTDNGKTAQATLNVASLQTPTITFGTTPAATYLGGNFTVSATTNSNGALSFSYVSGPCAQVSGGTFSSSGAGTCVIQASTAATTTFSAGKATLNVTIGAATPTITFGATPAPTFPGSNFTVSATTNSNGALSFSYVGGPCAQVSGGTFSSSGAGTCVVRASTAATANFSAGSATLNVTIATGKKTPVITWATPAPITYGVPLSFIQLNATANVPGTFVYSPKAGTILTAGPQTLKVTFTPADTSEYNSATGTVILQVNKAKPLVLWVPLPIFAGTPLGPLQLDALPFVPGTFIYTPPAGTILPAGEPTLSAVFTPGDSVDFETITVQATLLVLK